MHKSVDGFWCCICRYGLDQERDQTRSVDSVWLNLLLTWCHLISHNFYATARKIINTASLVQAFLNWLKLTMPCPPVSLGSAWSLPKQWLVFEHTSLSEFSGSNPWIYYYFNLWKEHLILMHVSVSTSWKAWTVNNNFYCTCDNYMTYVCACNTYVIYKIKIYI